MGEEPAATDLTAALEAILMVADSPVPASVLASAIDAPVAEVAAALEGLARSYQDEGRGFMLRDVGEGWRFYSHPDHAEVVENFVRDGHSARLTTAALETLAVIAYRQPVSRGRVAAVRGVNVDGVVRTLVTRGLIEESGRDEETGALLYQTTRYFLERLGLRDLSELPPIAPYLPDADALDTLIEGEQ